jgi:hypothetical protein
MIPAPPPSVQAPQAAPELPLLPGSDPLIFGTFQWAVAHSPSLQQLVRQLAAADRKARYRLVPGLDQNYGRLRIQAIEDTYDIDIEVPILAWRRCGDGLEPWIASALFLAMETASKGKYRETSDPQHLHFVNETKNAAFAFQAKVRKELAASDPERLKGLPDGEVLFRFAFLPGLYPPSGSTAMPRFSVKPDRRGLPAGVR